MQTVSGGQAAFPGAAMDLSTCGYNYNPRSMMDYFHSCKSEYTQSYIPLTSYTNLLVITSPLALSNCYML